MSGLGSLRALREEFFEPGARCAACGERDSIVFNSDARMILCGNCAAIARGLAPIEEHHVAGKRYDSLTLPVSVNTHRRLSALQRAWSRRLRGLPAATARAVALLRGFGDLFHERADAIEEEHADARAPYRRDRTSLPSKEAAR
jgi:hypothetical protein